MIKESRVKCTLDGQNAHAAKTAGRIGESAVIMLQVMSKKVLIVEDNELNMKLFRDLLEAHGYETVQTSEGLKALDMAPLLGTRTAGAGIWLSDRNPLVDQGQARVAEYAQYGLDGRWLVEGYGVAPDIEVENPPFASYQGGDAQLEAAISWLKDKLAAEPVPELIPQPIPPVGTTGRDVD